VFDWYIVYLYICRYVYDHSQNQCIVSTVTVTSDLSLSEFRSFAPRHNTLKKRENSYVRCWKCLRVAEFPWSGSHARPYCWNSKVNRLRGRWETRGWAEREEHDNFEADWGAWTHWSCHKGAWGHWSSEQQQLDEKLWGCLLASYEEILKENKRPLSRQTSVLDFFKSSSVTLLSPPA